MSRTPVAAPRIGPNSVVQTLAAFVDAEGSARGETLRARAGLPRTLPGGMVPERYFVQLVRLLRVELPPRRADAVLADAGWRTARYVAEHRIPRAARLLLRVLPRRLALPLLLEAIRRHAWTFAGAGRFRVEGRYPGVLVLDHAPTCRGRGGTAPSGAYYAAAFAGLLRLAAPGARVREVSCQSSGAAHCRYAIELPDSAGPAR